MRRSHILKAIVVILLAGGYASAQEKTWLAEVARREAERRQTVKSSGKVYTNADVKRGVPLTTAAESSSAKAADPQAQPNHPPAAPAQADKRATVAETRDEAWWRKRMSELTGQLNRSRLFAEALQSRISALLSDFTSRDDPAQRSIIDRNRNDGLAELERVKAEIAENEQAIANLEEEARKANVPPGWLR